MVIPISLCYYCRSRFICCCSLCWKHRADMREGCSCRCGLWRPLLVCIVHSLTLTPVHHWLKHVETTIFCFCAPSLVLVHGKHVEGFRGGVQISRRLSVLTSLSTHLFEFDTKVTIIKRYVCFLRDKLGDTYRELGDAKILTCCGRRLRTSLRMMR